MCQKNCKNWQMFAKLLPNCWQTLRCSFSAISKPMFASKCTCCSNYSLESSCRDLHDSLKSRSSRNKPRVAKNIYQSINRFYMLYYGFLRRKTARSAENFSNVSLMFLMKYIRKRPRAARNFFSKCKPFLLEFLNF